MHILTMSCDANHLDLLCCQGIDLKAATAAWPAYLRIALPSAAMICLDWWCFEVGPLPAMAPVLGVVKAALEPRVFYMYKPPGPVPVGLAATLIEVPDTSPTGACHVAIMAW
jgi:hypothetical protein